MSIYEAMQDGLCGFFKSSRELEEDRDEDLENSREQIPDDRLEDSAEADPKSSEEEIRQYGEDVVWHASPHDFDEFIFKEIGFHFAETKELAENAAALNGKSDAIARPYRITTKNMVEVTGQRNSFKGFNLVEDMYERGYIDEHQYNDAIAVLYDMEDNYEEYEGREMEKMESMGYYLPFDYYKQAEATVLSKFFNEWGIDGLKYWNDFDAYGLASLLGEQFTKDLDGVQPNWSYIVFDNSQITKL